MEAIAGTLSLIALLFAAAILASLAARSVARRTRDAVSANLAGLVQLALGAGAFIAVLYVTLYFLALVGGFYEALTCKVVTLPACEDPLPLPAWLMLPEQSVGGVIGVLPLLAVFLAKAVQRPPASAPEPVAGSWRERLSGRLLDMATYNFGVLVILVIEVWLAWLRGSAEAADREVRLALGLDTELPGAFLSVAQWGAVVLALGLSAVVIYLGIVARYGTSLMHRSLAELGYGAGLIPLFGGVVTIVASGLVALWTTLAIAIGRAALKLQHTLYRLWASVLIALGRGLLKLQSFAYLTWAFIASTLGWTVIWLARIVRPASRRPVEVLFALALSSSLGIAYATTYVILFDASGGEEHRIDDTRQRILAWADPSPQRALLERGDRLVVVPIVAPGNLDPVYSALFNATYPGSQLERYEFFVDLRESLPQEVDTDWGTGLSESLRAALVYLCDAPGERVLIVFGNGEDHTPEPVTAEELAPALADAVVVHLNVGLVEMERWVALYDRAGARAQLTYDLAATQSLRLEELSLELERALGR